MSEWTCVYCGQENPNGDRIAGQDPRCLRCLSPRQTREEAIEELSREIENLADRYQEVSGDWRLARNARDEAQVQMQVAERHLQEMTATALAIHKEKEIRMEEKAAILCGHAPRRPAARLHRGRAGGGGVDAAGF